MNEDTNEDFDPRLTQALNARGLVSGDWCELVHGKDLIVDQIEAELETRFYDDGTPMP